MVRLNTDNWEKLTGLTSATEIPVILMRRTAKL